MTIDPEFEYIDSSDQLADFCQRLSGKPWMIVDTEFLRENTYRPELCLVQIKSGELLAVIDTIVLKDLSPLRVLLHDENILKVLHAASQDMEIFYWMDKKAPSPVFDTQVAAPLLGYNEQIGYGNLVREMLSVELPKAHTRADWSRRPLPPNQVRYALDDVIYLEQLYLKMQASLEQHNRLAWLDPEFKALSQADKYDKPAREMWKKIRAAQKLKNAPLSVLQSLAEWRELQARESNLPRNWLVKDDVLVDIARQMPDSVEELLHVRGIGSRIKKQFAERLVKIICEASQREPEALPASVKKIKLTAEQNAVIDVLSAVVNLQAAKLKINPTLLASRKLLEQCVSSQDSSPLSGWRRGLIGEEITALLQGQSSIAIRDARVLLKRNEGQEQ